MDTDVRNGSAWAHYYKKPFAPPFGLLKLKKDVVRLSADPARYRYVFFAAPGYAGGRQLALETVQGVEVHCVET